MAEICIVYLTLANRHSLTQCTYVHFKIVSGVCVSHLFSFCVLLFVLLSLFCVFYPELHVSMVYIPQVATQGCDHGIRNGHVTCSIV
jgi:hypothetical protein